MLTPTEMTVEITWGWGQRFDLRCQSTLCTKLGDGLFHDVDESGELGRFGLHNGNGGWCRGVCFIKSEQKGHGTVDLLQGIWIMGEVIRELELESVGTLTPKLWWEAIGKGVALCCSTDVIFRDEKCHYGYKLPAVFA